MRSTARIVVLAVLLSVRFALAGPPAEPLPTMAELQKLMDDKQWAPLLQKLSRVLTLKGKAAEPYDRADLLMMKGEAHLQQKATAAAITALTEAGKIATQKEKTSLARAMVLMIKRSKQFTYTRTSPTSQPTDPKTIDTLDLSKRKDMFNGMAADEFVMVAGKVKRASNATSLPPIVEAIKSMTDLRDLELVSVGNTLQSDSLLLPLAKQVTDLTGKAVRDLDAQTKAIEESANKIIEYRTQVRNGNNYPPQTQWRYKKTGLTGQQPQQLKTIIADSQDITAACKEFIEQIPDSAKQLDAVVTQSKLVEEKANRVLTADYSGSWTTPDGARG